MKEQKTGEIYTYVDIKQKSFDSKQQKSDNFLIKNDTKLKKVLDIRQHKIKTFWIQNNRKLNKKKVDIKHSIKLKSLEYKTSKKNKIINNKTTEN